MSTLGKIKLAIVRWARKYLRKNHMILKTGHITIEVKPNEVLVNGIGLAKGKIRYFFTDQPADSAFHLAPTSSEPKVGFSLVVFVEGEDHPVYHSLPITEIQ